MDGTDRRIYQHQTVRIGESAFSIEENAARKNVLVRINTASVYMTVDDLDAVIQMLTLARERLEAFGTMEGLDKVVGT